MGTIGSVRHTLTNVPYADPINSRHFYASTKISGETSDLCSGTRTFSVKYISGATYTWTCSSTLSAVGASNTHQYVVQRNGSSTGSAWVKVQISTPCSSINATNQIDFTVEGYPPSPQYIQIYGHANNNTLKLCPGNYHAEAFFTLESYTHFEWLLPSGWTSSVSGGNNPFTIGPLGFDIPIHVTSLPAPSYIRVRAINACGISDPVFVSVGTDCEMGMFSSFEIYPNPATNNITIESSDKSKSIQEIRIVDKFGNIKRSNKYSVKTNLINLELSGLQRDVYFVRIFDGHEWQITKISLQ